MAEAEKVPRMQRFWMWLGLELGKRAGLVAVCGLLITLALGAGISKLEFATGQDSYLNADDQVYIENVEYQEPLGGQAMLLLVPNNRVQDRQSIQAGHIGRTGFALLHHQGRHLAGAAGKHLHLQHHRVLRL